jgi:hypothetical protein
VIVTHGKLYLKYGNWHVWWWWWLVGSILLPKQK